MNRKFQTWIDKYPATYEMLGKRLKCSRQMICHLVKGRNRPSLALAQRIQTASKGEVPVESWRAK